MSYILYIVAGISVALWAVGYFGFQAGEYIHILIVIALIAFLFRYAKGKGRSKSYIK